MKVFISWSGKRSKAVAEVLSDWIRCVLQAARPWMSARDIEQGSVWFNEIMEQLKDTANGIICLTQENKKRPWVLFEAGSLVKGLTKNRVCTLLVDLQASDVEDPLAQFHHTVPTKEGMLGLLKTLNKALEASALEDQVLQQVFDTYWTQFETKFKQALEENPPNETPEPRSERELLKDVLEVCRGLQQNMQQVPASCAAAVAEAMDTPWTGYKPILVTRSGSGKSISPLVSTYLDMEEIIQAQELGRKKGQPEAPRTGPTGPTGEPL